MTKERKVYSLHVWKGHNPVSWEGYVRVAIIEWADGQDYYLRHFENHGMYRTARVIAEKLVRYQSDCPDYSLNREIMTQVRTENPDAKIVTTYFYT